ncbi:MAG: murein biosynthesis integral membrane protein MurJ [Bacillota bacterium]|nr:murein biosynthesis integral membrane protein MurJ [Bacillota bacterium]
MGEIQTKSVAKAASVIMVAMLFSRILGYARDVVIYSQFGQNRTTDAYNAAFAIPDFLSILLMGGAFSAAFIPVFSGYLAKNNEKEAWEVASIIFNIAVVVLLVGITLGLIFTPWLIPLVAIGFRNEAETVALTVKMSRIMFGQAFFISLSGIMVGILNSYKEFTAPAIAGVAYNAGIIIFGLLLINHFGIVGFAIGVVMGAVLNFAVQLPAVLRLGWKYTLSFNWRHPGVKRVAILMAPMLIGLSVVNLNLIINQNLASTLPEGLVSALRAAQRIMQLPIGIFAVAIAVAVFPTLTEQAAKKQDETFKSTMNLGIRTVIFVTLPAAVGLMALGVPIVRLLFQWGSFTPEATSTTAYALFFYAFGIAAYSANHVLNRSFYALEDTTTPVKIAFTTIIINFVLNLLLIRVWGHGGLALANSLAGIYSMVMLSYFIRRKLGAIGGRKLLVSFAKTGLASVIMGAVAYGMANLIEGLIDLSVKLNQIIQVGATIAVAGLLYLAITGLLKMEEIEMLKGIVRKRIVRKRPVS